MTGRFQTFTPTATDVVSSITAYIRKYQNNGGQPNLVGTIWAEISTLKGTWGGNNNLPDTLLCSSDTIDVSTISATASNVTFTFPTGSTLTSGVHYSLALRVSHPTQNLPSYAWYYLNGIYWYYGTGASSQSMGTTTTTGNGGWANDMWHTGSQRYDIIAGGSAPAPFKQRIIMF
jgi:hypothetical protein